ncbi:MAG: hypothetical protein QOK67_07100 [Nitrososphaeraceae archaeon]|nr:hypothetical protein [Nitrososphaeraceae archaeon]
MMVVVENKLLLLVVVLKKIIEVEEIQDNIIKLDNNIPKDNFIFLVPNKVTFVA